MLKKKSNCRHHGQFVFTSSRINGFPFGLVSAGMELIFFPVAAVFWILCEKNTDNTGVFSCCCEIKDFFQFLIFS